MQQEQAVGGEKEMAHNGTHDTCKEQQRCVTAKKILMVPYSKIIKEKDQSRTGRKSHI